MYKEVEYGIYDRIGYSRINLSKNTNQLAHFDL